MECRFSKTEMRRMVETGGRRSSAPLRRQTGYRINLDVILRTVYSLICRMLDQLGRIFFVS
ncbi:hypothetical protein C2845_PM08G19980 [Panicum miliaceum]|uniref:Uncharacterized protein n=1 Tax=Panicum miliaceum TaxID=4540 RepID=A0A3L6R0C4_PANMI|nr:hypothetical protein C2845_PM08G19980 [Panicum miliaceum]